MSTIMADHTATRGPRIALTVAVMVGVVFVSMGHGMALAVVLVGIGGAGAMVALYRRAPTATVLMVWVVAVFEPLASVFAPGALGPLVKTMDEPLVLVLFVASVVVPPHDRAPVLRFVAVPALGLLLAGLLSDLLNLVPMAPVLLGTWQASKFWVLLFITVRLPWRRADLDLLVRVFTGVTVVVVAIAAFEFVVPGIVRSLLPVTSEGAEVRFGRTGLQSVFTHPGHFGSFSALFGVYFLARYFYSGQRKDLLLAVSCVGLGLLSLRLKVIMGLVGALGALALVSPGRFFRRIGAAVLVVMVGVSLGGGLLVDLAAVQIDRYLFSEDPTIRGALYETSAEIGADNFPFGEGFGRFGTGAATQFDSPVYDDYGIGDRRGLSLETAGVRHDTTWPTVIGETGYLGFLFFFGGIVVLWFRLLRQARASTDPTVRWMSAAAVAIIANVVLESLGRPSFYNAVTSMAIALVIAPPLVAGWWSERQPAERTLIPATAGAPDDEY